MVLLAAQTPGVPNTPGTCTEVLPPSSGLLVPKTRRQLPRVTLSWGAGLQMLPVLHQHQKEEEEHGEWGWHICRAPHPINLPPSYLHHALGQRPAERGCSGQCRRLLRFAPRMARSKPVGKQIKNLGSDGDREESYLLGRTHLHPCVGQKIIGPGIRCHLPVKALGEQLSAAGALGPSAAPCLISHPGLALGRNALPVGF